MSECQSDYWTIHCTWEGGSTYRGSKECILCLPQGFGEPSFYWRRAYRRDAVIYHSRQEAVQGLRDWFFSVDSERAEGLFQNLRLVHHFQPVDVPKIFLFPDTMLETSEMVEEPLG